MIELIKTIALLCSVASLENTKGGWTELPDVSQYQLNCQKYYLNCVRISIVGTFNPLELKECILKREVKTGINKKSWKK